MKKLLILLMVLLPGTITALAQKDCGSGLPCGPVPWALPAFPKLTSPTPMPTLAMTPVQPTQVSGAVPTPAPNPTSPPLSSIDTGDIDDQIATMQAIVQQTPMQVLDINGTPVDTEQTFNQLGSQTGQFFGYARSLSSVSFGSLSPLVAFSLLALMTVIAVKMSTFVFSAMGALFGIIRKVVQLILDFLPF